MRRKILSLATAFLLALSLLPKGGVFAAPPTDANMTLDEVSLPLNSAVASALLADYQAGLGSLYGSAVGSAGVVRAQGDNQLGWVMAAAAAVERHLGELVSENHMRHALSKEGANASAGFNRGVEGPGSRSMAAAYLMRETLGGPVLLAKDPLLGSGSRPVAVTAGFTPDTRAEGIAYIPDPPVGASSDERTLHSAYIYHALKEYGAVVASLRYAETYPAGSGADEPDHTVLIVGCTPGESFVVCDSLRADAYEIPIGTPLFNAYAVTGVDSTRFEKTYENDLFGVTDTAGYSADTAWFAGVFTVATGAEKLSAVSFFATAANASYEIYAVPLLKGSSVADSLSADRILLTSAAFALPGYYTVEIPGAVYLGSAGTRFAVLVKARVPYGNKPVPLSKGPVSAKAGRSYMSGDGGVWSDVGASSGDDVCLKAHTTGNQRIEIASISLPGLVTDDDFPSLGEHLRVEIGKAVTLKPALTPANGKLPKGAYFAYSLSSDGNTWITAEKPEEDGDGIARLHDGDAEKVSLTHTGVLTVRRPGDPFFIRAELCLDEVAEEDEGFVEEGVLHSCTASVRIYQTPVESVKLSKTELALKTNAKATLTASVSPAGASVKTVDWVVARDFSETETDGKKSYTLTGIYDQNDSTAPVTVTDKGAVTGIHPGVCYVAAVSTLDGITTSEPCKVTVEEVKVTGLSAGSSKLAVAIGAVTPLKITIKPSGAYEKGVNYASSDASVAAVDGNSGEITGISAGVAVVTCSSLGGSFSAKVTVTVTDTFSATLKKGASKTLKLTGAAAKDSVEWSTTNQAVIAVEKVTGPSVKLVCHETSTTPVTVAATQYELDEGGKILLVAWTDGDPKLVPATRPVLDENGKTLSDEDGNPLWEPVEDEDGNPLARVIARRQQWVLAAALPISKQAMRNDEDEMIKSLILSVGAGEDSTAGIRAVIDRPDNATDLGYVWSVNKPDLLELKTGEGEEADSGKVTLTAKGVGTVKLTAVNRNGNKKLSFTVKILNCPDAVSFKKTDVTIAVGKTLSMGTAIEPRRQVNKSLTWTISGQKTLAGEATTGVAAFVASGKAVLGADGSLVTTNGSAKLKALAEGSFTLTARAAGGKEVSTTITCVVPLKSITLSSAAGGRIAQERETTLTASFNPSNASLGPITWTASSDCVRLTPAENGKTCMVKGVSAGRAVITVSAGGKKKTFTLLVTPA